VEHFGVCPAEPLLSEFFQHKIIMIKKFSLTGALLVLFVPAVFASADTLSISGENVSVTGPQIVTVRWMTNAPATGRVVYGPVAQAILAGAGISPQYGYASSTPEIAAKTTEHALVIGPVMAGMTYFRPVSSDGSFVVFGNEVSVDLSAASASCSYVNAYLKKGAQNDPTQVARLQAFLRGVERDETVSVNGTFDDATYNAVVKFQEKYKEDVLAPWGVDAPTGYVYITTKRKINEIFCSTKIALTAEEEAIIAAGRSGATPPSQVGMNETGGGSPPALSSNNKDNNTDEAVSGDTSGTTTTSGSVIGGTGDIGRKLSALSGGVQGFLSHNQLLVLIVFVLIFAAIYVARNKKDSPLKFLKGGK
jgi:hypothetical protein